MADGTAISLKDAINPDRGISYGIVQPGSHIMDGVPIIRVSDIRHGRIDTAAPIRVHPEIESQHRRTRLRGGELLITIVGTVGETVIVPEELAGWNVARAVAVLSIKPEIGAYWVQLALRSPSVRAMIDSRLNTTVQATLNLGDLAQLPILLPPSDDRKKIGSIIEAFDKKIEVNRQMNETLEAMARAIFKDWFVDFGPTRAKMAGTKRYVAPAIWKLFPERLDDAGRPLGWTVSTIGQEVSVVGGTTPSTSNASYWDGDLYWATPKDLSSLTSPVLLKTERRITPLGLSQIGSGLLPVGSVLLSSRAPIGYLVVSLVPTAINQGFIGMVCDGRLTNVFVWLWTKANIEAIHQKANGSTFQEISKANFRPIPVIVPTDLVLNAFEDIARPLFNKICENERETRILAATRDLLLPKLMSGEIRVRDAERALEAVT